MMKSENILMKISRLESVLANSSILNRFAAPMSGSTRLASPKATGSTTISCSPIQLDAIHTIPSTCTCLNDVRVVEAGRNVDPRADVAQNGTAFPHGKIPTLVSAHHYEQSWELH